MVIVDNYKKIITAAARDQIPKIFFRICIFSVIILYVRKQKVTKG
jgi:hypothetical protein